MWNVIGAIMAAVGGGLIGSGLASIKAVKAKSKVGKTGWILMGIALGVVLGLVIYFLGDILQL